MNGQWWLNKRDLRGPLWVAADLHLGPTTPATTEAFLAFLASARQAAATIALLGDIFDAWIGDDLIDTPHPWLTTVVDGLKQTAAAVPVWLGRGNRDFLLGQAFCQAVGAQLLPDQVIVHTDAGAILLSHGDEYCTDDTAYQQFRTMVRDPTWQATFLAQSMAERLAAAAQARSASMIATQNQAAGIMDVNPTAVRQAFQQNQVGVMVHGHTHRPDRHLLVIDGKQCERWVLPDWEVDHAKPARGGWLVIDRAGIQRVDLAPTAPPAFSPSRLKP